MHLYVMRTILSGSQDRWSFPLSWALCTSYYAFAYLPIASTNF